MIEQSTQEYATSDGDLTVEEVPDGATYFSAGKSVYAVTDPVRRSFRIMEVVGGLKDRMVGHTVACGTAGGGLAWFDAGEIDAESRAEILRVIDAYGVFP